MEKEELKKLKVARYTGKYDEFKEEDYKDYDIVYDEDCNVSQGQHNIHIFKQPENIGDWDLAYACDGFFWSVSRCGKTLHCYYD